MNKNGQSLVFFVLLLPLILALLAFVFDSALIIVEENKLENIASIALESLVVENRSVEEVINLIRENDSDIKILNINPNQIHLIKNVDSYFGQIIGINTYQLEKSYTGKIDKGKFKIEEGN